MIGDANLKLPALQAAETLASGVLAALLKGHGLRPRWTHCPAWSAGWSPHRSIAVPTSVGYGASFDGFSALLTMLNSCASGVAVVNIDNGFGAGYLASIINQMKG